MCNNNDIYFDISTDSILLIINNEQIESLLMGCVSFVQHLITNSISQTIQTKDKSWVWISRFLSCRNKAACNSHRRMCFHGRASINETSSCGTDSFLRISREIVRNVDFYNIENEMYNCIITQYSSKRKSIMRCGVFDILM